MIPRGGGPSPGVGRGDHEGSEELKVVKADGVGHSVPTAQFSAVTYISSNDAYVHDKQNRRNRLESKLTHRFPMLQSDDDTHEGK